MQAVGPSRRVTWVSAVALLSLGAALGTVALTQEISTLPAYQTTAPFGVLPPIPYALVLLTAGAGLLADLSGAVRWDRGRWLLWCYATFALWVVVVYSLQAVLWGPVRPFAALTGYVAVACAATSAWWSDGI